MFSLSRRHRYHAVFQCTHITSYTPLAQLASEGEQSCELSLRLPGPRFLPFPRFLHLRQSPLTASTIHLNATKKRCAPIWPAKFYISCCFFTTIRCSIICSSN